MMEADQLIFEMTVRDMAGDVVDDGNDRLRERLRDLFVMLKERLDTIEADIEQCIRKIEAEREETVPMSDDLTPEQEKLCRAWERKAEPIGIMQEMLNTDLSPTDRYSVELFLFERERGRKPRKRLVDEVVKTALKHRDEATE